MYFSCDKQAKSDEDILEMPNIIGQFQSDIKSSEQYGQYLKSI